MRKKPFSRQRMLKPTNGKLPTAAILDSQTSVNMTMPINNNNSKILNNNLMLGQQNRERLSDGLNSITRSILQTRGVTSSNSGLDQSVEQHDDVPLRPLLLNGNTGHLNAPSQQDKFQK